MPTELHVVKLKDEHPAFIEMRRKFAHAGSELLGWYRINQWLQAFVAREKGLLHLSLDHPRRYPTWDEIKGVRYALLPDDKTFAIILPPSDQYVNQTPNCFHLHEVPELHEESQSLIIKPWQ